MAGLMKTGLNLAGAAVALAVTLALAGCSGGTSGLMTGSLLPTAAKPAADPTIERAIQVGTTSARASKCGYNFDPQKLKHTDGSSCETGDSLPTPGGLVECRFALDGHDQSDRAVRRLELPAHRRPSTRL